MTGTVDCIYETPCGWCTKWDKKCDAKTSSQEYEPVECAHKWVETNRSGSFTDGYTFKEYIIYKCNLCGEEKRWKIYGQNKTIQN